MSDLVRLLDRLRGVAEYWSACWCTVGPHGEQRQKRDCPRHGSGDCRYMAEGIVTDLAALVAEFEQPSEAAREERLCGPCYDGEHRAHQASEGCDCVRCTVRRPPAHAPSPGAPDEVLTEQEREAFWAAGNHGPEVCDCTGNVWDSGWRDPDICDSLAETYEVAEHTLTARLANARTEMKAAVEEWFSNVSLDDLFRTKGWGE